MRVIGHQGCGAFVLEVPRLSGTFEVKGSHIDYSDDTGFTADGEFVDENTLHHGGMIFRRR